MQLKSSNEADRRSLNNEVIACLETLLLPRKTKALEHVAAASAVRSSLKREQHSCLANGSESRALRAITRISNAWSWVNIDNTAEPVILAQGVTIT